jgi:hypothetical protein
MRVEDVTLTGKDHQLDPSSSRCHRELASRLLRVFRGPDEPPFSRAKAIAFESVLMVIKRRVFAAN